MKNFLRKNLMIVVSVSLPLLVVIFFALASVLPGLYSTPPAHDLLLSLRGRDTSKTSKVKLNLIVREGRLKAVVSKAEKSNYDNNPRLFRFDHLSGNVSEVIIPLPEKISKFSKESEISIPELEGLKVSEALEAPDGYEFRGRRGGAGIITELFGGRRSRTDVSISKNGAIVRVRLPTSDYWYNDVHFVGWIIERGK